ncbi:MAG: hypothetical protein KDK38_07300 [Leptospiraceae bacterium]|nr:hypothetical protein [Leptospiraceae bacterium]
MKNMEITGFTDDNPPVYLFDLIRLSIYAQDNDREKMSQAVESALDKGADGKQIMKALFRAEKFQQMSNEERNRVLERGVNRLTTSRLQDQSQIHLWYAPASNERQHN